jgi:hypothetical protein
MQQLGKWSTLLAALLPIVVGVSFSSQGWGGQTGLEAHINDLSTLTDHIKVGSGMLCSDLRATVDQGTIGQELRVDRFHVERDSFWYGDAGNDYLVQSRLIVGRRVCMSESFQHPAETV